MLCFDLTFSFAPVDHIRFALRFDNTHNWGNGVESTLQLCEIRVIFFKELKMKLRRLREKLRKLKADYNYNDDEEETEKSEMETLKDLKQATEQAIRELQEEAVRASKRKGWNMSCIIKEVLKKNLCFTSYKN